MRHQERQPQACDLGFKSRVQCSRVEGFGFWLLAHSKRIEKKMETTPCMENDMETGVTQGYKDT